MIGGGRRMLKITGAKPGRPGAVHRSAMAAPWGGGGGCPQSAGGMVCEQSAGQRGATSCPKCSSSIAKVVLALDFYYFLV